MGERARRRRHLGHSFIVSKLPFGILEKTGTKTGANGRPSPPPPGAQEPRPGPSTSGRRKPGRAGAGGPGRRLQDSVAELLASGGRRHKKGGKKENLGLWNLAQFCHDHRFSLKGCLPTRKYLSDAGRIDLADVIRKQVRGVPPPRPSLPPRAEISLFFS